MTENKEYIVKLNTLWSDMISNGMTDSLSNITQISLLIFLKEIDLLQTHKESTAALFEIEVPDPIFSELDTNCRWSIFKNFDSKKMYRNMIDRVMPFIKYSLKITHETAYGKYLQNTVFAFTNSEILSLAVATIDYIDFEDSGISNECYNFLLSNVKANWNKGQYRTPAHFVDLMVQLTNPKITDKICDPACGTGSFLVSAANSIYTKHSSEMINEEIRNHFENDMFSGFDIDHQMTDITAMNLSLSKVSTPNICTMDSLCAGNTFTDEFTLILTNPPFSTPTDPDYISESLQTGFSTSNTAVLFFRLILRMLKSEGRCAAIIPDNLLFGVHNANMALKQELLDNHRIDAIISLSDTTVPYFNNRSSSIIVFTKDVQGGTDEIWYYNLSSKELVSDLIYRFNNKDAERTRTRYDRSFFISKDEIVENNYMLIMNRYQKDSSIAIHSDSVTALHNLEMANNILKNNLFELENL